MATPTIKRQTAQPLVYVGIRRTPQAMRQILERTWGLWRGRKINPIAYQKKARKEYETIRPQ